MSKLLNLIAYSLECLITCTNRDPSCIRERLQSTHLELLLLTLRSCLSHLYILVLVEIEVLMLVVIFLKLLYRFISYLAPCYIFAIY
jgi:hypothetical protein